MKKKLCTKCKTKKTVSCFDKRTSKSPYLRSWCRTCHDSAWNPHRKNISNRIRAGRKNAKKYGYAPPLVSIDQIISAEIAQNGFCACCKISFGDSGYHLDHCHTSGAFRGLLCSSCNLIEGMVSGPEQCEAIAAYIRKFQCIQLTD